MSKLMPLAGGTVVAKLERGFEILSDPRRWGKGRFVGSKGECCLLGACGYGFAGTDNPQILDVLSRAIDGTLSRSLLSTTVSYFNDNIATHADILDVLKRAIKIARKQYA